jgi:hypothetical protein
MTKPAHFTQRDIERAIAGALKGGWAQGAFMVEVTPAGALRLLPVAAAGAQPLDPLDEELAEWRARNADG